MRYTEVFADLDWADAGFSGGSAVLAVASVFIWSLSKPWILRLSGAMGAALCLAAAISSTEEPFTRVFSVLIGTHCLIQALVLIVWLGCGPILPKQATSDAARS
jgi:hypothetical protein